MTIEEKQLKAIEEIKKFYPISSCQIKQLESFVELLMQCNEQFNLIGKSTIDDVWHRHILDSAQLLKFIPSKDDCAADSAPRLAGNPDFILKNAALAAPRLAGNPTKNPSLVLGDFGSGAGFPAIVLSILGVKEIHLIEKSFRKCEFLQKAAKISSGKIVIHQKKAEEIKDLKFDIITSRAFAPLDKLIAITKSFSKEDGFGIFLKGKNFENEINLATKNNNFKHAAHPSLTSSESRVLIINYK